MAFQSTGNGRTGLTPAFPVPDPVIGTAGEYIEYPPGNGEGSGVIASGNSPGRLSYPFTAAATARAVEAVRVPKTCNAPSNDENEVWEG
jgi:hypothetical protein